MEEEFNFKLVPGQGLSVLDPVTTLISDLRPLNPFVVLDSLRLVPGHWTSCSPSTFDHAQLYLGNPSIISAYPAPIADVTRFSIVSPFIFPES